MILFSSLYAMRQRIGAHRWLDRLSAISYPLYLLHATLGFFYLKTAMLLLGWGYLAALSAALATAVLAAFGFAYRDRAAVHSTWSGNRQVSPQATLAKVVPVTIQHESAGVGRTAAHAAISTCSKPFARRLASIIRTLVMLGSTANTVPSAPTICSGEHREIANIGAEIDDAHAGLQPAAEHGLDMGFVSARRDVLSDREIAHGSVDD